MAAGLTAFGVLSFGAASHAEPEELGFMPGHFGGPRHLFALLGRWPMGAPCVDQTERREVEEN